jgi:hypothetical protein
MAAQVFISYAKKDRIPVKRIVLKLRLQGIECWVDESGIEAAASWRQEIANAIQTCKVVLFIVTPQSTKSEWVVKELSLASDLKKSILPLRLDEAVYPPSLQLLLAGIQYLRYDASNEVASMAALTQALIRLGVQVGPAILPSRPGAASTSAPPAPVAPPPQPPAPLSPTLPAAAQAASAPAAPKLAPSMPGTAPRRVRWGTVAAVVIFGVVLAGYLCLRSRTQPEAAPQPVQPPVPDAPLPGAAPPPSGGLSQEPSAPGKAPDPFETALSAALDARARGAWSQVSAALEEPLKALCTQEHPNRRLGENLLALARVELRKEENLNAAFASARALLDGEKYAEAEEAYDVLAKMEIPDSRRLQAGKGLADAQGRRKGAAFAKQFAEARKLLDEGKYPEAQKALGDARSRADEMPAEQRSKAHQEVADAETRLRDVQDRLKDEDLSARLAAARKLLDEGKRVEAEQALARVVPLLDGLAPARRLEVQKSVADIKARLAEQRGAVEDVEAEKKCNQALAILKERTAQARASLNVQEGRANVLKRRIAAAQAWSDKVLEESRASRTTRPGDASSAQTDQALAKVKADTKKLEEQMEAQDLETAKAKAELKRCEEVEGRLEKRSKAWQDARIRLSYDPASPHLASGVQEARRALLTEAEIVLVESGRETKAGAGAATGAAKPAAQAHTLFVLKDGRRIKATMCVVAGEEYSLKNEKGELMSIPKAAVAEMKKGEEEKPAAEPAKP